MTLTRLARTLAAVAAIAAVVIAATGAAMIVRASQHDREIATLVALQARIDRFSSTADALLLAEPDDARVASFLAEADALRSALAPWVEEHPSVAGARTTIGEMAGLARAVFAAPPQPSTAMQAEGPLALPVDAVRTMRDMAALGDRLDDAIGAVLRERQARGGLHVLRAELAFAGTAAAFALAGLALVAWLHRRVVLPVGRLTGVADRVSAGDLSARSDLTGHDELARLGRAFDRMLDRVRDGEARLRTEQDEARARAARLATTERVAHVGSWDWTVADDRLVWSDETYRITGLDPTTAGPKMATFLGRVHPDDAERVGAAIDAGLRGGGPAESRLRVVRPDGDVRHVELRAEPVRDDDGRVVRFVGSLQDVTEQVAAQEELAKHRRLLEVAGQVSKVGGWWHDVGDDRITLSDRVCDLYGVPRGTTPTPDEGLSFYPPEHHPRIAEAYERCVRDGEPYDLELELVNAQGRRFWIRTTGVPVFGDEGRVVRVQGAFQDVDDRKRAELTASVLGERLRSTLETLTDGLVTVDAEGRCSYANPAAVRLLAVGNDHLIGLAADDVCGRWLGADAAARIASALAGRRADAFETRAVRRPAWLDVRVEPTPHGAAIVLRDVTTNHELLARLRERDEALGTANRRLEGALELQRALIGSLPANVALLDAEGRVVDVNERWRAFASDNQGNGDAVGSNYLDVTRRAAEAGDADAARVEAGLRAILDGRREAFSLVYPCHAPAQEHWYRLEANRLRDGVTDAAPGGVVVMHVDVTESMLVQRRLERMAYEDALTGLPSRVGFLRQVEGRLAAGWPEDGLLAAVNVVGLANINDAHGHAAGDALLRRVGERLVRAVGHGGLAGRIGGDEFVAFLQADRATEPVEAATALVERVFGEAFDLGPNLAVEAGASVGITRLGSERRAVDDLLREAELALNDARGARRRVATAFTPDLDREVHDRTELARELRDGIDRGELRLRFQPKVDLASGRASGVEALVRWAHPQHGLLAPDRFVPIAEQSGLIVPLGRWVLDEACRVLACWRDAGVPVVPIAINVSIEQFATGTLAEEVQAALERHDVPPAWLSVEMTETVFARESPGLQRQLEQLRRLGVRLALDDFGTGYSSLAYLKAYRFDAIKIDREFVSDVLRDRFSRDLVATVVQLATSLGARSIAEGVETREVADALLGLGCHEAQGYHFARPLAEPDVRALLEGGAALPRPAPDGAA